jgi:hypothetical protein
MQLKTENDMEGDICLVVQESRPEMHTLLNKSDAFMI